MRLTSSRRRFFQSGSKTPSRSAAQVSAPLIVLALILAGCGEGMSTSADPALQQPSESAGSEDSMDGMDGMDGGGEEMRRHDSEGDGLQGSLQGLTIDEVETDASTESGGKLSFRIALENGTTATQFVREQGKYVHTYLVSQDLGTYLHLHPLLAAGTWSVDVPALPPGQLHVVANFVAADADGEFHAVTLGTDLDIGGSPTDNALPKPAAQDKVDGYTVTLDETLTAGEQAKLNLTVTKGGAPLTLEPYLESWAHTSALAADSLALFHLHPAQEWKQDAKSPEILTFVWTPPAPGDYRIFIEFMADGELHRAEFTRTAN